MLGLVGMGTIALGGLFAPVLVTLAGTRGAFVVVGLALVALASRSASALRGVEDACRRIDDSGRWPGGGRGPTLVLPRYEIPRTASPGPGGE